MSARGIEVVARIADVRRRVADARARGLTIGFVPTMGALHAGHARLIEQARAECGFVVVSIFVNPTQFGPNEDLTRYPRTPEADFTTCASAGADLVFMPDAADMYPAGGLETYVEVPGLSTIHEGAHRPGHFRGVATVVAKLFGIVAPDAAYFGRKDYQQLLVIRRMVADLDMPVQIRDVPTVREPDGLALSSRNRYLAPDERQAAVVLSRALAAAEAAVAAGERRADSVRRILAKTLESEAMARPDYAEVVDAAGLTPIDVIAPDRPAVAILAVRIGATRLVDNALLAPSG